MFTKIVLRIQKICIAAKIAVLLSTAVSILLFLAAIVMSLVGGESLAFKYLYEQIAVMASEIFALGIFSGLCGDFLVTAVDRNRK